MEKQQLWTPTGAARFRLGAIRGRNHSGAVATVVLAVLLLAPARTAANPPPDFERQLVLGGISQPMGMGFLPDGRMLIIRKPGEILIADPSEPTPLATAVYMQLPNVNSGGERGLIDITIDPDFSSNGLFYVYFTPQTPQLARVSVFSHVEDAGGLSSYGDPDSEVVLWQDNEGYVSCCHYGGGLDFGPDGRIYLTTGDKFDGLKAQDLSLLAGKVICFDRDGTPCAENLGLVQDGPGGIPDSIHSYGLRNPFRARWDLPTGRLIIGEVGGNVQSIATEDIHLGEPGANYGYPLCEGPCDNPDFPTCSCLEHSDPLFYYPHAGAGASVTGGVVYRGSVFPSDPYGGAYFYGDFSRQWVRYLTFDPGNPEVVTGDFSFETNAGPVVAIEQGLDGALYWLTISGNAFNQGLGDLSRFVYVGDEVPVITQAEAAPKEGPAPLTVNFQGSATDNEGPLSFTWFFGDGVQGSGADVTHVYDANGVYQAKLEVSDGSNTTTSAPIIIEVGEPPVAAITQPPDDSTLFQFGDTITFVGSANDPDGVTGPEAFQWACDFVRPTTRHPAFGPLSGTTSIDFTIPVQGQGFSGPVFYECTLTVTDDDGLSSTAVRRIFPEKVDLQFETVPTGLTLFFDGIPEVAPFVKDTLKNFQHPITAPANQCIDGSNYVFQSWSDGGAAQHTITVPQTNTTYVATYSSNGETCEPPEFGLVLRAHGDSATTTDGAFVDSWLDLSIQGNDLSVVNGDPLLISGALNGQNTVRFDGVNDGVGRDGLSGFGFGFEDRSIFMVVRYDSLGFGGFSYGSASCGSAFGLGVTNMGDLFVWGWCTSNDFPSTTVGTGAGWLSQAVVYENREMTHYADGVMVGQAIHTFETFGTQLRLGVDLRGGNPTAMEVAEVLVYDRAVSEEERQLIEAYFTSKYFDGAVGNLAPLAGNDNASVASAGGSVSVNLLANDDDPDGFLVPESIVVVDEPVSGFLSPPDPLTGAITYTHDGSTTVTDQFRYTVEDDAGVASNVANVFINIGASGCELPLEGLVVHLETDFGVGATGNVVETWLDQSGNGNDLTSGGNPTLLPANLNGRDVISFDGVDDKLERVGFLGGVPAGSADRSMFSVVNFRSGGYGGISYGDNACNETFGLIVNPFGDLMLQGWCGPNDFASTAQGTGAGWLSQSVIYSDNFYRHFKDGVEIDGGSHSFATDPTTLVLGAEVDSNPYLLMDVAAFLLYNRALSEFERQQVEAYLQNRYLGAPCGGTNAPPQAVDDFAMVVVGSTVEIDVTANDTDTDGVINPATVTIVNPPVTGAILGIDAITGVVTYSGVVAGSDAFTYTVEDEVGAVSLPATVDVTVSPSTPGDGDGDGFTVAQGDCDDTNPNIAPGLPDGCDLLDNDCDMVVDEDFVPVVTQCGIGGCSANGVTSCVMGMELDSCTAGIPAADDSTCDLVDSDCDGQVDEDFVPVVTQCGIGGCSANGVMSCVMGMELDSCTAGIPAADDSTCDSVDSDCDGQVDEDCTVSCSLPADGVVLRLRGDGVEADVGAVTAWLDQSALGNDLLVTSGSPQLLEGGLNGHDVVSFDGIDDGMGLTGLSGLPLGPDDRSIFTMVSYDSVGWGGFAYGNTSCNQAFGLGVSRDPSDGIGELFVQGWCGSADFISTVEGTGGGWLSQAVVLDDDLFTHYADGVEIDQGVHAFNTSGDKLRLGIELRDRYKIDMEVAEVVVYDRAVSEAERQQIEDYFQNRYFGISCGVGTPGDGDGDGFTVAQGDCDDTNPNIAPGLPDGCDLLDNDCDMVVDEDFVPVVTQCGIGACSANGVTSCVMGMELDSCTAGIPAADDSTCDLVDSDCDGQVDEDCTVSCSLPADGVVLRLRGDGVEADVGAVTAWLDQSALGNDLLVTSGSPQLLEGGLNGHDVVSFDGIDDGMGLTGLSGLPLGPDDRSIFTMVSYDSVGWGGFAYGNTSCNQAFGLGVSRDPSDGIGELFVQGWCGSGDFISTVEGTGGGWLSQAVVLDDDLFTHYADGVEIDQGVHAFNTSGDKLRLGIELRDRYKIDMEVAEVVVYDRAVSEAERQQIEDYFQNRYFGIPCQ